MSYSKEGDDFVYIPVKKVMDRMKGIGFIVDTFGFPKRPAAVIKHGDVVRCEKMFGQMLKNTKEGDKVLSRSILFVDVSAWDIKDINSCVEEIDFHPRFIEKYKVDMCPNESKKHC